MSPVKQNQLYLMHVRSEVKTQLSLRVGTFRQTITDYRGRAEYLVRCAIAVWPEPVRILRWKVVFRDVTDICYLWCTSTITTRSLCKFNSPESILYKSIASRYRPFSYPDGPITARYRFIKNASWETTNWWYFYLFFPGNRLWYFM